jgi:hypothetical protein
MATNFLVDLRFTSVSYTHPGECRAALAHGERR